MSELFRRHVLPERLTMHCLICGHGTSFSIDALAEDGEGPYIEDTLRCGGCGNDLDPRLERDLRAIAVAAVSIRYFLPAGPLPSLPKREKTWSIVVETASHPPEGGS